MKKRVSLPRSHGFRENAYLIPKLTPHNQPGKHLLRIPGRQGQPAQAVLILGQGRISYNRYQWQMLVHISYPGGTIMTQTVDGLMRLTGRSVNDPAGNPVSAEQWFYDGESNLLKMISREEQANYQYNTLYQLTGAVYKKKPVNLSPKPVLTNATVASATEASIGVLWQYMMGDCQPGFEFSGMAVLAMQNCGYSCLNPRN